MSSKPSWRNWPTCEASTLTGWTWAPSHPVAAVSWPRSVVAPLPKPWSDQRLSAATRSCWPRWPKQPSRSSTSWSPSSTRVSPVLTPGPGTASPTKLSARVAAAEDRLVLLDDLLAVLADPAVPDEAVGRLLRAGISLERLQAARRSPGERLPADRGHLGALEDRYAYLRSFVPAVIAALPLAGGSSSRSLLRAVDVLRDLNDTGRRRVPDDAPVDFVPARWQSYLDAARQGDRGRRSPPLLGTGCCLHPAGRAALR